jgi:hypothetical protein
VIAAIVALVLSSPILWAQFAARAAYDWQRDESLLVSLSAKPRDYLNPPRRPWFQPFRDVDPKRPLWTLGDGPLRTCLGLGGIIAGLAMAGRRRWTLFLVLFGSIAFGLSLGPPADVAGWSPYKTLIGIHPGLALARSPFRFAFFVQLALALLAANVFDVFCKATNHVVERLRGHRPLLSTTALAAGGLLTVLTGAYATAEVWPAGQKLFAMPPLDSAWIQWLRQHSDPAAPVLCLPFPAGSAVGDYERTAIFMLEQIGHRRPMVGGYSGFFPADFLRFRDEVVRFPAETVMNDVRRRGVEYIVIADPNLYAAADRSPSLALAFRDGGARVRIYKVLPPPIDYERFFTP